MGRYATQKRCSIGQRFETGVRVIARERQERYDAGVQEKLMMHVLRKSVMLTALAVFGFSSFFSGAMYGLEQTKQDNQTNKEEQTAAALVKLGAPIHKDSEGFVRWIEAAGGELSDEAMRLLPSLSKLEWLEIGGGKVTPSGVANLKGCAALKRLYIHDINLDGNSLDWLANLKQLEALSLQRTGITGNFLKNLKAIDTITVLNISGNPIINDDLAQIAVLKNLEVLALANTKISATGMAKLEGMKRLNELNLMNCPVSNEDVLSFLTMPNLRIVYAEGCNISDMEIMDLKMKFPMLAIFR
jgi:hypothetical protein